MKVGVWQGEVMMEMEMRWNGSSVFAPNSEVALIQAAQQGDVHAFNRLVLANQDSVYGWVASLVRDDMLADDITQWTFVTAYKKLSSFRGGSFKGWLFTIARNRSYDELRYQKKYASISLDHTPDDEGDQLERLPNGDPLPEEELIRTEQAAVVHLLLGSLPDMFRQVLWLIDMDGLDYQEAADILRLPLGTIKSRLARARLKMRDLYMEAAS